MLRDRGREKEEEEEGNRECVTVVKPQQSALLLGDPKPFHRCLRLKTTASLAQLLRETPVPQ